MTDYIVILDGIKDWSNSYGITGLWQEQKNMSDIIFIQELPCYLIYNLFSNTNLKEDLLYSISNYPEWLFLIQNGSSINDIPYITTYINK